MDVVQVIPKDAIPSIDSPAFDSRFNGEGTDRVVVPDIPGEPFRAYPLRILNFHEIVNDRLGDIPIAVTWCPLCGTIVVYDRRVDDRTLSFGVSGKLADDNLVMYDRETGTEWKQSLGEGIDGELACHSLDVLPAILTTWEQYRSMVGDPLVLQETRLESEAASNTDEPAAIDYDRNPYRRYVESDGFGLAAHRKQDDARSWGRSDIDPKEVVLGIGEGETAIGVPKPVVEANGGVVTVEATGTRVVVLGTQSGIYAYEDPGIDFTHVADERFKGDGATWHAVSGKSDDGRELTRIPSRREFAFTWQDDHGPDAFFTGALDAGRD